MDIAKKLRQVVTANFIEIVRSDEDERPKQPAPALSTVDTLPPVPTRVPMESVVETQSVAELKARQELDALDGVLDTKDDGETPESVLDPVEAATAEEAPLHSEPVEAQDGEPVVIEAAEKTDDDTLEGVIAIPIELHAAHAEVTPIEAESAPAPEPPPAVDPMSFVNSDGSLDFARMLKAADIPPVSFTAEQALKLITALPEDLPMRVKRTTVKATLEAVSPTTADDARDVVADAMLKRVHVGQFRDALSERLETELRNRNEEMTRLRAELERLGGEVVEFQRRQKVVVEACDQHIHQFQQVVLFFQTEEAGAPAVTQSADDDEIPPFMREDTVFRLLGMNGTENPVEAVEEPVRNGGATTERGRSRR